MKFKNNNIFWRQSVLVAAVSSALLLTGCVGDDGENGSQGASGLQGPVGATGPQGSQGQDGTGNGADSTGAAALAYTSSDYEIYADAIFIAPDANDGDDITLAIKEALLDLTEGAVLVLPKGDFKVTATIKVQNANNVTFTGYGINETKLRFDDSTGDDGFRFESNKNISIRDFSVYEAPKNGIKVIGSDGIYLAHTGTIWEGPLEEDNGAYGLYPLQSTNIIMEHNYAYGSADAGVYVGQSSGIIVRNNVAKNNVAGIEIENSFDADVYNNLAIGNSGGILVFDLPGLEQAAGGRVRVFDNQMIANNAENVGNGAVGIVPPGTGALVFATSNVEFYNNTFKDNETSSIELASYFVDEQNPYSYTPCDAFQGAVSAAPSDCIYSQADADNKPDDGITDELVGTLKPNGSLVTTMMNGWTPYVKNINVFNNEFSRSGDNPRGELVSSDFPGSPGYNIISGFVSALPYPDPATGYIYPVRDKTGAIDMGEAGIRDRGADGDKMPAILYGGLGEFLINSGAFAAIDQYSSIYGTAIPQPSFAPYKDGEQNCVFDNVDANSYASALEFGQANIGIVFPTSVAEAVAMNGVSGSTPNPIYQIENLHGNEHLMACDADSITRLPPAVVTFRGQVYGCEGDDLSNPSCSL